MLPLLYQSVQRVRIGPCTLKIKQFVRHHPSSAFPLPMVSLSLKNIKEILIIAQNLFYCLLALLVLVFVCFYVPLPFNILLKRWPESEADLLSHDNNDCYDWDEEKQILLQILLFAIYLLPFLVLHCISLLLATQTVF